MTQLETLRAALKPLRNWYEADHGDGIWLTRDEVGYLLGIHQRPTLSRPANQSPEHDPLGIFEEK